jgi:DNA-binding winged helix-turn-helix (wHTH) protein
MALYLRHVNVSGRRDVPVPQLHPERRGVRAAVRDDRPVRLERRPMDLLILLVQRRQQLVSRSEITALLWGEDVFVEIETGTNTAVRKIRHALRDPANAPVFIETVPGKRYRFIAPVEVLPREPEPAVERPSPERPMPARPCSMVLRLDRSRGCPRLASTHWCCPSGFPPGSHVQSLEGDAMRCFTAAAPKPSANAASTAAVARGCRAARVYTLLLRV